MEIIDLPAGWSKAVVGDYFFLKNGFAFKSNDYIPASDKSYPVIRISDLDGKIATDSNAVHVLDGAPGFEVKNGDLLIAMSGATTGKIGVYQGKEPAYQNQRVGNLKLHSEVNGCNDYKNYLVYFLSDDILKIAYGGAQPNISGKAIEEMEVLLPPLAEQKVIAEKLDTLLAQVDNTKARLERIPDILKSFRQSVLAAAVSGKLTEEWRATSAVEPCDYSELAAEERISKGIREAKHSKKAYVEEIPFEIPGYWQWFRLGNLALKITDGAHNTPKVISEGYPYIMAKDLTVGFLDFSEKRYISEKEHRELYLKCIPERDDLLIVNIGAGTGNNVLVDVDFEFSFKNIAIIKRPSFILGKYLKFFFDSQKQRIFDEQTRGGAQPFLSLTVLNDLAFALPPIEEQTEIVRRVEELFAFADRIEHAAQAALSRVNNLTQSILAKAFRGELTADWRADNPELISGENSAEALLARIKAERAKVSQTKKGRGKSVEN